MKKLIIPIALLALSGCASTGIQQSGDVLRGPQVTANNTPYSAPLACIDKHIAVTNKGKRLSVTVTSIPDMSGTSTMRDDGRVTQGAGLMAMTALGKLDNAVRVVERQNTSVYNFEYQLAGSKVLGDGVSYMLPNGQIINYRPIKSGSVLGSDYYITGAITELNRNIRSGGVEVGVSGVSAGARKYVMNVAGDFRIVNTKTLEVVDTISVQKEIIGYEVKAGVFKFFGCELVDINAGAKIDEPLGLGIRTITEYATGLLIARLYGVDNYARAYYHLTERKFTEEAMIDPEGFARDNLCVKVSKVFDNRKHTKRKVVKKRAVVYPSKQRLVFDK